MKEVECNIIKFENDQRQYEMCFEFDFLLSWIRNHTLKQVTNPGLGIPSF